MSSVTILDQLNEFWNSALQLASMFPNVVVENFYVKTRNAIKEGKTKAPYGYVIPVQRDMTKPAELINILRAQDIGTVGTVLIGLRDDTEEKIKKRLETADEIDPDVFALDYLTPVPNSPDWRYGIRKGWFDPEKIDLQTWDFQHPVIPTDHLSISEVGRLGAWCMREYYSKPERIHRIMDSNYDIKVKLCVKDFMSNIAKWEKNSRVQPQNAAV